MEESPRKAFDIITETLKDPDSTDVLGAIKAFKEGQDTLYDAVCLRYAAPDNYDTAEALVIATLTAHAAFGECVQGVSAVEEDLETRIAVLSQLMNDDRQRRIDVFVALSNGYIAKAVSDYNMTHKVIGYIMTSKNMSVPPEQAITNLYGVILKDEISGLLQKLWRVDDENPLGMV